MQPARLSGIERDLTRVAKRRTSSGTNRKGPTKAEREFVSEAEEILEQMRGDLADLGDQRSAGSEVSPDIINGLFRSAHTLKSLAGMFGFEPMRDLSHQLENVLDGLRLGRVSIDSSAPTLIGDVVRLFASLLGKIWDADALSAAADQIAELTEQIQELTDKPSCEEDELGALVLDPAFLRALTEYEEHRLRENIRRGRQIVLADSTFEIIAFEEGLSSLTSALRELGEVISTLPSPGNAPDAQIRFSLLAATDLQADALCARLAIPDVTVVSVLAEGSVPSAPSRSLKTAPVSADSGSEIELTEVRGSRPTQEPESLKSVSDTVRVDIHKLDELMNLVGELVIQRGAIGELVDRLVGGDGTVKIGNDLAKIYKSLDGKLSGLQAAVLDVRMVPLGQVFEKVSRVVRGLRRDLDKDVALEVSGANTELDKLIVEELVDPVMHIVRNAFDHAIEPTQERVEAGKDPRGTIRIEASQRGNHVVISVTDDGSGIDGERVRARAEQAGLVRPEDELTEKEIFDLIFLPGLSTREEVSETSGRGVGMDVVRSNLTALGGIVEVNSTVGRGTKISMTLPITLAIVQSLVVVVSGQKFAIPLNSVLETLLVGADDMQHSEGREILNLRGEPLLLRRLAEEFGLEPSNSSKSFVVVLAVGEQRMGLIVDKLEGQQDTVIKAIQGPVTSIRGVAGATELGGAEPVLVLDVVALVEDASARRLAEAKQGLLRHSEALREDMGFRV